jgi:hypothetical protein
MTDYLVYSVNNDNNIVSSSVQTIPETNLDDDPIVIKTDTTGFDANSGLNIGVDANNNAIFNNKENTDIIFSTNNDEKLRIKNNGDVNLSNSKLLLNNNFGSANQILKINSSGDGLEYENDTNPWNTNNNDIYYDNGNVGIGTSTNITANKKLEIKDNTTTGSNVLIHSSRSGFDGTHNPRNAINANLTLQNVDTQGTIFNDSYNTHKGVVEIDQYDMIFNNDNNLNTTLGDFVFKHQGNEKLKILNDGTLNITNPKITLNGNFGAAGQVLKVKSDGLGLNYENTNWNRDNNINWYNGAVGINVTSSSNVSRALECRGEILLRSYYVNNVAKASLFVNNAIQSSEESFILYTNPNYTGSGGWGKVIIITNSRNVGIGALPGATDKLYVNGNIVASGSIQGNSDARIKKNIGTANYHDIYNKFKKLRLTEYGYIDEYCQSVGIPKEKVVNGLIAQELKEVYPDLVAIRDKQDIVINDEKILSFENFHRINFTKLVMKLIGVIKILQTKVEDNEIEINDLKNENETLEADNQSLNTRISTLETALDTLINKLYDENILTD